MLRRKTEEQIHGRQVVTAAIRQQASVASVRQFTRRLSGLEPVNETSQRIKTLMEQLKNLDPERD